MDSQYIVSQSNGLARIFHAALGFPRTQTTEFHSSSDANEKQCWDLAAIAYKNSRNTPAFRHGDISVFN